MEDVGQCWRLKAIPLLLLQEHVVLELKVGFWTILATSLHQLIAFTVTLLGDGEVAEGHGHYPPEELSPLTEENLELSSGSI